MSRSCGSAEQADVFGTLRAYVFDGVALETPYSGGGCGFVRDGDGVVTGPGFHNHLQSSGESSTSIVHAWSSPSVTSTPTSLSWCCISVVVFSRGKGDGVTRGEQKGSLGQLRGRIDGGISGQEGVRGGGISSGARGTWVSPQVWALIFLSGLNCSLHWVIGPVIGSLLVLQE